MKRVMIFIDGSNMYHSLQLCAGRHDLDYHRFIQKLCGADRELDQTYYYNIEIDPGLNLTAHKNQQRFFYKLTHIPNIELRLGRRQRKSDGSWCEKGVDVKLAIDMLDKAYHNQYDVAILVSGDGDFSEVVQAIQNQGKDLELAAFSGTRCYHLRQKANHCIEVNASFLSDCWADENEFRIRPQWKYTPPLQAVAL